MRCRFRTTSRAGYGLFVTFVTALAPPCLCNLLRCSGEKQMDHYNLYRSDRPTQPTNWVIRLVEILAAIAFVLIVLYLVR